MSKAAKRRHCPAVQHDISPAECGENRGSRYACPSDCHFSPLASENYELLLELETEVDRKTQDRFKAEQQVSPALRKAVQQALNSPSHHAFHAFCECALFFQKDAEGLSLVERWRRQGFPGLNNDERVLMQAKMRTRIALLEIHRIIDDEQIEGVDLLEASPRPMLLRDRSLAARMSRFATALVWIYPLPHYWRLSGTGIPILEMGPFDPDEIIREIAQHLGGPIGEQELRAWLAENFVRFDESLTATYRMRRMQTFASMDAQFGKAVYELRAPFGACRDALDKIAEVESDSLNPVERDEGFADARVWMSDEKVAKAAGVPFMLGRVLLGQSHCRLESIGAERLGRFRQEFEKALGDRARFVSERFDDPGLKSREKEPKPNQDLIPPKLLQEPVKIVLGTSRIEKPHSEATPEEMEAEARDRHYRSFLENPVPALDGQTPRQASQNPALRPKLIRLLKSWVRKHDEENLRTGRADDINWLLRELGASEIMFDAPPLRARLSEHVEPAEEGNEDFIDNSDFPLPILAAEPLSLDEVSVRVETIYQESDTAQDALDYLEACGSTFIEDAFSLCSTLIKQEEFDLFVPCLIQARFVLVPRGFREPDLDFDRLADAYEESLDQFHKSTNETDIAAVQAWFKQCRQPALAQLIAAAFCQSIEDMPRKQRLEPYVELVLILTLIHMIDELDQSIRM